jgi:hypothetical protein
MATQDTKIRRLEVLVSLLKTALAVTQKRKK